MAIGKLSLGGKIYVFSGNSGQKNSDSCIIDAHGEQFLFGNTRSVTFTVPDNMTLHFYVPYNAPQIYQSGTMRYTHTPELTHEFTTALEAIMEGTATENNAVTGPSESSDYVLTKIQSSEGGLAGGRWSNYIDQRNTMKYTDVEKFMKIANHTAKDIITIRNRPFKSDITLSEIVTLLRMQGYNYTDIHCSFCRSPKFLGGKPAVDPTA
jgi:hypothetical protein